ncbi:mRNA-decapping enzyme subunit 2, partial [Irineochytrium annulatum]
MSFAGMSFRDVLDDLQSRFIINVPSEELSSVERICFQIEQAHWFYEDFVREENTSLKTFSLKNFSARFFAHCPLLEKWANDHESAFQTFMEYKVRVPVCGAIILNEKLNKVLLVRGWKSHASWGFPKGKINKEEAELECAVREVLEETGFDISAHIRENEYVERTMKDQRIRLYIITGVPETTTFVTQTRKEIGDIKWHNLVDLPGYTNDKENYQRAISSASSRNQKYYMVTAFVGSLVHWIKRFRSARRQGKPRSKAHLAVVSGYKSATDWESDPDGGGAVSDTAPAAFIGPNAGRTEDEWSTSWKEAAAADIRSLIGMTGAQPAAVVADSAAVGDALEDLVFANPSKMSAEHLAVVERALRRMVEDGDAASLEAFERDVLPVTSGQARRKISAMLATLKGDGGIGIADAQEALRLQEESIRAMIGMGLGGVNAGLTQEESIKNMIGIGGGGVNAGPASVAGFGGGGVATSVAMQSQELKALIGIGVGGQQHQTQVSAQQQQHQLQLLQQQQAGYMGQNINMSIQISDSYRHMSQATFGTFGVQQGAMPASVPQPFGFPFGAQQSAMMAPLQHQYQQQQVLTQPPAPQDAFYSTQPSLPSPEMARLPPPAPNPVPATIHHHEATKPPLAAAV